MYQAWSCLHAFCQLKVNLLKWGVRGVTVTTPSQADNCLSFTSACERAIQASLAAVFSQHSSR